MEQINEQKEQNWLDASNDFALPISAENAHLDIINFLVETGANIGTYNDFALRFNEENAHLDVVKILVKKRALDALDSFLDALFNNVTPEDEAKKLKQDVKIKILNTDVKQLETLFETISAVAKICQHTRQPCS